MSIKISKIDQNYSAIDFNSLKNGIEDADREDLTTEDLSKEAFAKSGTIPSRVALASASQFGLRKAYFDIWKPANPETKGVWKLSKEADGTEWITQEEDPTNTKHS
jgi:hypothetical protein